jgi:hypothetical protein
LFPKGSEATTFAYQDVFAVGQFSHDTFVYNGPAMMQSANVRQLSGSTFAYPEVWRWNFSNENEWPFHWPSAR